MVKDMIASIGYTELFMAIVCFLFLHCFATRKGHPWNWPLIGMTPLFFPVFCHLFDNITNVLERTKGTFFFKGPWFGKRDMIFTTHPENLSHIMSSNVSNYPKGPDTKILFEPLGETLFTADHDEWTTQRKVFHAFLNHELMHKLTPKIHQEIIENGLFPVLDCASEKGQVLDLQDLFKRFMLDVICKIATGYNRGSLRIGFPEDEILNALHDIHEGILMRHLLPARLWQIQNRLKVWKERKLQKGWEKLDLIAAEYLEMRSNDDNKEEFNAISFSLPKKLLVDDIKSLLFGGTDTVSCALTWFFWNVHENPRVRNKIREEIEANLSPGENYIFVHNEELNKLVYLHATLLESMRLYPPIPLQTRTCTKMDILPSGHRVSSMMKVVLCFYAMGRMKSIWGKDCREFKPERWISEKGSIISVPSNKFTAFSSGPRICPGKNMALNRLKAVAATIIHNYDTKIITNHPVIPKTSIILDMKYGLKATISKRSTIR